MRSMSQMSATPAFVLYPAARSQRQFGSHYSQWSAGACRCGASLLSRRRAVHARRPVLSIPSMQNGTARDTSNAEEEAPSPLSDTPDSRLDELINSVDSSAESTSSKSQKPQYSLRARLREETEAPFRKARMFVYAGSAVSAGVGAFISGLRIIAALSGVSGTQPMSETIPNLSINLGVITVFSLLLRAEMRAGERRLERMSRGARIASLRIEDSATRQVLRLKDLRGRSRIVLVAGTIEKVSETMSQADEMKEEISKSDLLIVPYVTDAADAVDASMRSWRMHPYAPGDWQKWYEGERGFAKVRRGDIAEEVLVVIVRLDGRVGARSVGAPMWDRLVSEIAKLPTRDQYGKP